MRDSMFKAVSAVLALALLAAPPASAFTQDKPEDQKKILEEIVGTYDFTFDGQTLSVVFSEEDGKLLGAPVGEAPEEIKPVEGKPLYFDITVSTNGVYYELQFVRNDKGVIDKCIMKMMGMEIEGVKAVK